LWRLRKAFENSRPINHHTTLLLSFANAALALFIHALYSWVTSDTLVIIQEDILDRKGRHPTELQ
jgi:hypothetical protein